jgi:hypothetical protein
MPGSTRRTARPRLTRSVAAVAVGVAMSLGAGAAAAKDWQALYGGLLARYTRAVPETVGTVVDYAGLRAEPKWRQLIEKLGRSDPRSLKTRDQKLAFWINAYNIFAIDLVVQGDPHQSIKDLGNFLWPVWKREAGKIAGRGYSLDEIEHDILRKLGEPRIHAAIVCASTSCPSLRRVPFSADAIDEQLDEVFRNFVADTRKGVRIDAPQKTLFLSSIFDWFGKDFESVGGVLPFVRRHLSDSRQAELRTLGDEAEIEYLAYDWSLNRARSRPR